MSKTTAKKRTATRKQGAMAELGKALDAKHTTAKLDARNAATAHSKWVQLDEKAKASASELKKAQESMKEGMRNL